MNSGDGEKIEIWGGISGEGTTTAVRIFDGTINAMLYCNVLQSELKQSMAKLSKKTTYTFQQDLAPWHTSKLAKEKMAKMKLNVLEWAAKSPDLNPIEMLWSILDTKLTAKPIYSKTELCQRLQEE